MLDTGARREPTSQSEPVFRRWARIFCYALDCPDVQCQPETTLAELMEKGGRDGQLARKAAFGHPPREWMMRLRFIFAGSPAQMLFAFLRLSFRGHRTDLEPTMTVGDVVTLASGWQLWPAFVDDVMQLDDPMWSSGWRTSIGNLFTLGGREQMEWSGLHTLFSYAGDVGPQVVQRALETIGEFFGLCPHVLRPWDRIVGDDSSMEVYVEVMCRAGVEQDRHRMFAPETGAAEREAERHYARGTLGFMVASLGWPHIVPRSSETPRAEDE